MKLEKSFSLLVEGFSSVADLKMLTERPAAAWIALWMVKSGQGVLGLEFISLLLKVLLILEVEI